MWFSVPNRSFSPQRQERSSGSRSHSRSTSSNLVQRANSLIGRHVKINRGGPDMVDGRLLAIPADFLVVSTKDGIVYVNAAHVKSITEISGGSSSGGRSASSSFITASSFNSLLSRLRHQFIQINRGGPEKIDGFLAEITSNTLVVVVNREVVRIPVFHIKTVNVSGQGNKNQKSGGSSSGGSSSKRSGGSSGNRSGGSSGGRSGSRSGNRSGGRSGGRS